MKINVMLMVAGLLLTQKAMAECQIYLSTQSVSYGTMKPDDVVNQQEQWSMLPPRSLKLNVVCEKPEKMTVFANGSTLGKGFQFAANSLVLLEASEATLDGKAVKLALTETHTPISGTDIEADKLMLGNNRGFFPVNNGQAESGQQFSVTLTLSPMINIRDAHVPDKTQLESNITFNVDFGRNHGVVSH
ncbi:DUF1120 domain-containing protein [Enterobacter ludwigii]